jgi:RecB family exonuclease
MQHKEAEPAHARLSPSGHHWLQCPAAPRLSEGQPDTPSRYAQEGTDAHAVLESALTAGRLDGDTCANYEQFAALQIAMEAVASQRARFVEELFFHTERRVYPSTRRSDLYGTADVVIGGILASGEAGITVIDYKHGQNVAVPASSPQLAIYLLGAANSLGIKFDHFRAVIVQPRLRFGHMEQVRWHDYTFAELLKFSREMHAAAALTDDPDAQPIAGSHCKWCKAKPVCPAYEVRTPSRRTAVSDADAFGGLF